MNKVDANCCLFTQWFTCFGQAKLSTPTESVVKKSRQHQLHCGCCDVQNKSLFRWWPGFPSLMSPLRSMCQSASAGTASGVDAAGAGLKQGEAVTPGDSFFFFLVCRLMCKFYWMEADTHTHAHTCSPALQAALVTPVQIRYINSTSLSGVYSLHMDG